MSKFVHLLGYVAAFGVVGILVMTATGQLGPVLRGDLGYDSSMMMSSESNSGMMNDDTYYDSMSLSRDMQMVPSLIDPTKMVPEHWNDFSNTDNKMAVQGSDSFTVNGESPDDVGRMSFMTGTAGGGDTGRGGAAGAGIAGALVCAAGVDKQNKAEWIGEIQIFVSKKPDNGKFEYQAAVPLAAALKALCFDGKDVPCPNGVDCQKDPDKPSIAAYNHAKCTVTKGPTAIRDAKKKVIGWKATVTCTAHSCTTTQECIPKPKQQCCESVDGTAATCKLTCDATTGERSTGEYSSAECATKCKPTKINCCKTTDGRSAACKASCDATKETGTVMEVSACTATTCSVPSSSSSSVFLCCKNKTGAPNYTCKETCGTTQVGVPIIGTCDTFTNCKSSSSSTSSSLVYCCKTTATTPVYSCSATACVIGTTPVPISGACNTTTNCKASSSPSSPPSSPPPSSGGSRCTGSTPVGTTCSNTIPCDVSKGDCFCKKHLPVDIHGLCK